MVQTLWPDKGDTEAETLARPSGLEPQRKRTSQDELGARVVLISPYGPINALIQDQVRKIIPGGYTDVISSAETDMPPYIDVERKEEHEAKPLWIIDFGGIIARCPSKALQLSGRMEVIVGIIDNFRRYFAHAREEMSLQEREDYLGDTGKVAKILQAKMQELLGRGLSEGFEMADSAALEKKVLDVVPFHEYLQIARGTGVTYITPSSDFSSKLGRRHAYDRSGNFDPNNSAYLDRSDIPNICSDLSSIHRRAHERINGILNVLEAKTA